MIRYFLLNIATWNIFFLRLKAGSSPTPPDITSGPKMASFPSTSFFCVWKSNTGPSWTLWMYVFLFSEPTLLFSERTSKTGNQHILSGQLVREKSKQWLFPWAGRGEWLATKKYKKMIKLCYILHIFALTLFLFLLFCPIGGRKIYAPIYGKIVCQASKFWDTPSPFWRRIRKKNLTDFLWFPENYKRISKHFVQSPFRRHWFLTLVAILPISVTTLSTSEFDFFSQLLVLYDTPSLLPNSG